MAYCVAGPATEPIGALEDGDPPRLLVRQRLAKVSSSREASPFSRTNDSPAELVKAAVHLGAAGRRTSEPVYTSV